MQFHVIFFGVLMALHTGAGIYRAALSNLLTLGLFMDYSLDEATSVKKHMLEIHPLKCISLPVAVF